MRRVIVTCLLVSGAPAAGQSQVWVHQFGAPSNEDYAYALAPDEFGGTFVAGTTHGSLAAPNVGGWDIWLARYDHLGERSWITQFGFGNSQFEQASALVPLGTGGFFAAGETECGGGNRDSWLGRYDAAGVAYWTLRFSQLHPCTNNRAWGLAPDGAGGALIGGWTYDSLGGPSAGASDVYLARFSASGTELWITQFGTPQHDVLRDLAPDGAGGLFATGNTTGSLGGPSAGGSDAWLARYDGAGNRLWIRQFGTSSSDTGFAVCPDAAGGVFVGGHVGPASGGLLARYDALGDLLWDRQVPGPEVYTLAPDGGGGVYASVFSGIGRFDSAGNNVWMTFGLPGSALAIERSSGASVFVAGGTGMNEAWIGLYTDDCYPDCNADTQLTVADFGCFQTRFVAGDPYADCNGDGSRTVADFGCFQTKFVAGCP